MCCEMRQLKFLSADFDHGIHALVVSFFNSYQAHLHRRSLISTCLSFQWDGGGFGAE
jgi:hypothetical protein